MPASLPPDLEEFVERELAAGKYQTADEVVCEALRLMQQRERRLEALRTEIDVALDQIRRGEVIELPDEEAQRAFFEDIKTRGMKRLNSGHSGQ